MYGQKASLGVLSTGITIASWWMWGVTMVLAVVAIILLVRVFLTLHSRDAGRRP